MTRIKHLEFCSICIHQKDDMRKGTLICGLTGRIADFEDQCSSFAEDPEIIEQLKLKEIEDQVITKMASQGKRLQNYLLDQFFVIIFILVFALILGIVLAIVAPSVVTTLTDNFPLNCLISVIVTMIYYIGFEAITGRSIAKYMTKTKVVTEIGEKPSFNMILVRSLCRCIPFEAFSILFNDGSCWHDTISNTRVINI